MQLCLSDTNHTILETQLWRLNFHLISEQMLLRQEFVEEIYKNRLDNFCKFPFFYRNKLMIKVYISKSLQDLHFVIHDFLCERRL